MRRPTLAEAGCRTGAQVISTSMADDFDPPSTSLNPAAEVTVHKFGYVVPVRVVGGVPQCHCCQESMVERDGGWMCALGSTLLDRLSARMEALDLHALGESSSEMTPPRGRQ